MKNIEYDANEQNIDRMLLVQKQKHNHVKMLNTIYKKKSYSLLREERQVDKERSLRQNNQIIDKQRKWRETQQQINYENTLLRKKLLHIYVPKQKDLNETLKTNQSFDNIYKDSRFGLNFGVAASQNKESRQNKDSRKKLTTYGSNNTPTNNKKVSKQKQVHETNTRFFQRLSSIKSQVMPKLNLKQHSKDSEYFKQMIMKRSPKRQMRMKKFVQKNMNDKLKLLLPISKSYRQVNNSAIDFNPEETFVFY